MGESSVGFRFHPNEEELINHFLVLKLRGRGDLVDDTIGEIDVYRRDPPDLPDFARIKRPVDRVWYFFCHLEKKYLNSKRANRRTPNGIWKLTGVVRKIKARGTNNVIGTQKKLVFHYKVPDSKDIKTNWVIHEYQHINTLDDPTALVVCKLKNKAEEPACFSLDDEGEPSRSLAYDRENHTEEYTNFELIAEAVLSQSRGDKQGFSDDNGEALNDFVNSILAEEDESNDNLYTNINHSRLSEPFSNLYNGQTSTSQHRQMKSVNGDDILLMGAGSEGSSRVTLGEINFIEPVGREFPKTQKPLSPPQASKCSGPASKDQARQAVKHGASVDLTRKGSLSKGSGVKKNMVLSSKPNPDLRSEDSTSNDLKGTFIHLKTHPSCHNPSPPYVHLTNAVIGLFCGIIILWKMLH